MSGIAEVQARIATISSRIDMLSSRTGRAQVDPLLADSFASSLSTAVRSTSGTGTTSATTGAAGTSATGSATTPLAQALASTALGSSAASAATGVGAGAGASSGPYGADVVAAARTYLGVPYLWGGTDPAKGLDCSGLVQRVFKDLGVDVPRTVADQRKVGTEVASMADARPGDLLVYDSRSSPSGRHIAIYVGDGQMLHARRKGTDVMISEVWPDVTTIRRVVPAEASTAPAAPAVQAASVRPAWADGGDLGAAFQTATARYDLPAGLLQAVAHQESGMRSDAVSPAGARGLMQLMPGTARELGVDPMDPVQSIDGAARYLRQQLDAFGRLDLALAAYNAGPGNVRRHDGVPPFAETQKYVAAITAALGRG